MEEQIKLCVTCGGETQTFLMCDSAKTTWADLEAMIKVSFDLNNVQMKYFDEDNEEVSVNSAEEYEELLKSAVKQGKQIQMNAYEVKLKDKMENHSAKRTFENNELKGSQNKKAKKKEMKHYSQLAKVIGPEMKVSQEAKKKIMPKDANQTKENWQLPPVWFTEYMEMFKETFVREAVDRICCDFFEKMNIQQRVCNPSNGLVACPIQVPEVHTTQVNCYDWLMTCNNCQSRILGIRYQCSICPTYTICDSCEAGDYRHDPNHALLKLRKALPSAEITPTQFGNSLPGVAEQTRLQKQIDKTFLKAEKQRLRAEKRQRKAEFKEIKKQLKLQKKHLQWNGVHVMEQLSQPIQEPKGPKHATSTMPVMSTLSAEFVDENFPDGSCLQPGFKFIKHWRMKNTGTANWTSATKLQFMWGNLTLAFPAKKEVSVPFLQPGEIGVVSVKFVAPNFEGTYTSHWRLAHKGEQFGPRVWCSIVIDAPLPTEVADVTPDVNANSPFGSKTRFPENQDEVPLASEIEDQPVAEEESTKKTLVTEDIGKHPVVLDLEEAEAAKTATIALPKFQPKDQNGEFYTFMPSVDLLTAQDLLSFELLDINIVQEMEHVPNNTPVDMTPCMSPLPYDGPLIERPGLVQIEEENEANFKSRLDHPHLEEGEEDISGTQFVCETVIRSLALDEAPDLLPRRRGNPDSTSQEMQETCSSDINNSEWKADKITMMTTTTTGQTKLCTEEVLQKKDDVETAADGVSECFEEEKYEVESQGSSDCSEDYIIILPECFDTSRPLGESMYSSALSQPEEMEEEEEIEVVSDADVPESENAVGENKPQLHNINDILCISQTLEMEPLKPEVVSAPLHQQRNDGATLNSNEVHSDILEMPEVENQPVSLPVHQQKNVSPALEVECAEVPRMTNNKQLQCPHLRHHSGIAGDLVKGALSVAASAYKALFAGDANVVQAEAAENQTTPLMDILFEMGFCDRQLNTKLLKKHNNNLIEVVNELLQINDNDWYTGRH
ncbi:NBR1 autophagy cargo receptor a isoform X2 [Pristis pectinata]|uniref:NBR1 autophagy cargo receptor a isoform X2 n=1 Tax=Pristis pectinata TaxID=685728 RepID=UPI00223C9C3B|nr:NBR1 autophagy cargo receptor a isoform X2 [Pristis pectinata]